MFSLSATRVAAQPRAGAAGASLRWAAATCPQSSVLLLQRTKYADGSAKHDGRKINMEYEGQIRLKVHGTTQWVWVDVKAQSVEFARALLQAQYGRPNVLNVQQKRRR